MTRIAVIGSTGQLGHDLVKAIRASSYGEVVPLSHADIECGNAESVRGALLPLRPEIVVNCAAFVRVDDAEDQADTAFRTNALGALYVGRACAEVGALCVYVSTDYVFDGEKDAPYTEEDIPHPISLYGASKLTGEILVQQSAPLWLIMRTASLFGTAGSRGKGGNFVETILSRARRGEPIHVVDDIRMSPAFAQDVADVLVRLLRDRTTGIIHVVNGGSCTWFEFAREICGTLGIPADVRPIPSEEYPFRARRPRNSALDSIRWPSTSGAPLRPWGEALRAYVKEKGYRLPAPRHAS